MSFIKKAGTVILLSTIFIWYTSTYGFENGTYCAVEDFADSFLGTIGNAISWIFIPQGFGNAKATVAAITGLVAKENVVGTFGILYGLEEVAEDGAEFWGSIAKDYTAVAAYAYLIFNLLCAPCFAAIGAIKREMNNAKWNLVCNWISVSACLLRISGDQSGWKRYLLWCIHSMADRCNCTDRTVHLAVGSSI